MVVKKNGVFGQKDFMC